MNRAHIFWLLGLALCSSGYARLGETRSELEARFGPPVSAGPTHVLVGDRAYEIGLRVSFRADDWDVICYVTENRCSKVVYQKTSTWTDQQRHAAITANGQGLHWTQTRQAFPGKAKDSFVGSWERPDGAKAEIALGTITITTPAFDRAAKLAISKANAEPGSGIPKNL